MAQQRLTLPAPVQGLNLVEPLPMMGANYARELTNFYCDTMSIKTRGGSDEFVEFDVPSAPSGRCQTVAVFHNDDGTPYMLAISDEDVIGMNTSADHASIVNANAPTVANWQTTEFMNNLHLVNGTDTPKRWSPAPPNYDQDWVDVSWGGVTSAAKLINVCTYKRRLYFLSDDAANNETGKIWYGALEDTTGVTNLTSYDCRGYLSRSQRLMLIGSTTCAEGPRTQERLVVVSEEGEVLCFEGSYPGHSTWNLVGKWSLSRPFGYRSHFHLEGDYHIITVRGIISMSTLFNNRREGGRYKTISKQVDSAIFDSSLWSTSTLTSAVYYPKKNWLLLCNPAGTSYVHWAMNVETGAWSKITGWDCDQFAVFDDDLYGAYYMTNHITVVKLDTDTVDVRYGDNVPAWAASTEVVVGETRRNSSKLYKAATSGTTGSTAPTHSSGSVSDGGVTWTYVSAHSSSTWYECNIPCFMEQAYNYLGDPKYTKQIKSIKPTTTTSGSTSMSIGFDVDFEDSATLSTVTIPSGTSSNTYSMAADPGLAASLYLKGAPNDVTYEHIVSTISYVKGETY